MLAKELIEVCKHCFMALSALPGLANIQRVQHRLLLMRNRKRKRNDVSSRLQIAFSRLPMEVHNHNAATLALRHLRTVLIEYCNEMREKENSQSEEKANSAAELLEVDSHIDGRQRNKNLLSPNTVAQIALTAFAACVFSSGVDGYLPSTSRPESNTAISFESTLASLIGDTSERCKIPEITHAVQAAITQLMSSPLVDNMSSLHILSLARLLSHLDTWAVENIFARAILQCSSANSAGSFRGAGLTVVPKLFATYLSLLESHATKSVADISSMNYLLNNFFDRLRVLIDEEDNGKCIDPAKENADDGHLLVENLKVQTSSSHQDFLYVLKCTTSFLLKCE